MTCLLDQFYPRVGLAAAALLRGRGVEVVFNGEQTCCGQPAFNAGHWREARAVAADAELRESLCCVRCGACLNACPVYCRVGGPAYEWVSPGPIGSVLTPQLIGLGRAAELTFARPARSPSIQRMSARA